MMWPPPAPNVGSEIEPPLNGLAGTPQRSMLLVAVTGEDVPAKVMLQNIFQFSASGLEAGSVMVSVVAVSDPMKDMKLPDVPDKVVGRLVNVIPVLLPKSKESGTLAALVIVNVPIVMVRPDVVLK